MPVYRQQTVRFVQSGQKQESHPVKVAAPIFACPIYAMFELLQDTNNKPSNPWLVLCIPHFIGQGIHFLIVGFLMIIGVIWSILLF